MCGRFVGFRNFEQLKQYFPIDETVGGEAVANYNVAPTQAVQAVGDVHESIKNSLSPAPYTRQLLKRRKCS